MKLTFVSGPYLYQSFRSGRQFNYLQLDDESSNEKIPTCAPPARPPQPKSVSVPVSIGTDSPLIDLSDLTRRKETGQSPSLSNGTSHSSGATLLDSSIVDKYQYLPEPIGDGDTIPADPFEIRTSVAMLLPTRVKSAQSSPTMPSRQPAVSDESCVSQPNLSAPSQTCSVYSNVSPEKPPETYANVPCRENELAKAASTPSATSSSWSTFSSAAGHSPYYATPPSVTVPKTSAAVSSDRYKAFEWVNDAVAGFSLTKDCEKIVRDNTNAHPEKQALGSWEKKDWAPLNEAKTVGQSIFYDANSDVAQPNTYANVSRTGAYAEVLNEVSVKDLRSLDQVRSRQDSKCRPMAEQTPSRAQCRSTDAAPALPPRAPIGRSSATALSTSASREQLSRIQPVVQAGEQVSYTHYWLIPEKERQMAAMRCSPGHHRPESEQYANLDASNPCVSAAVNAGNSRHKQYDSDNAWQATGVTPSNSDMYQNIAGLTVALPSVSSASSMSSFQSKIERVRELVHGVTQEECHTALAANQWAVDAAMKYLKVEQLFRLGVTTRERCRELLEAFQWNLETAGSVLLDELHTGSSV